MHYYQHHIGDFNNATRHLNRVERSIYRDLIELYYDKESPLTSNLEQLCRKVMANTEEECVAVQVIVEEFFTLEGEFYHHWRCDEAIEEYQAKAAIARANGKKGGRPKTQNKPDSNPEETQSVILANPEETGSKANHKPLTINQEPLTNKSQNIIGDISDEKSPRNKCPVQKIVNLYHEKLPELPKVEKITTKRRGYIQQRWREDLQTLESWGYYFDHVRLSDFLMGKSIPSGDRKPFIASLEWLTNPSNFAKVAEEKYHG